MIPVKPLIRDGRKMEFEIKGFKEVSRHTSKESLAQLYLSLVCAVDLAVERLSSILMRHTSLVYFFVSRINIPS